MKISFLKRKDRKSVTARVFCGDGDSFEKAIDFEIPSGVEFDNKAKRFNHEPTNDLLYRFKLGIEDSYKLYLRLTDNPTTMGFKSYLENPTMATDTTLHHILSEYLQELKSGRAVNRKTKAPLAQDTVATRIANTTSLINATIDLNFDFGLHGNIYGYEYNIIKAKYNKWCESVINKMLSLGYRDNTIATLLSELRAMIKYAMSQKGNVAVGDLISGLRYTAKSQDVETITLEQTKYLLENYQQIYDNCKEGREKDCFQYWIAGLLTLARVRDMDSWTKDDLQVISGTTFLVYYPHKSLNTSKVKVKAPVPDILLNIFNQNAEKHNGKLLPVLTVRSVISGYIKQIGSRLPIFQHNVTRISNKGGVAVKETKPQWEFLHIHMTRATGISNLIQLGESDQNIKALSGHTADSSAYRRYVQIREENMKNLMDNYMGAIRS